MCSQIDFENLNLEKNNDLAVAYNRSKLMNVLFTRELAKKLEGTGMSKYRIINLKLEFLYRPEKIISLF